MDLVSQNLLLTSGGLVADGEYIDDIFSTFLYAGNGGSQTINNGIDLSGEGGLTWIKMKSSGGDYHHLYDTERGAGKTIFSNVNIPEQTSDTDRLSAFTSNGFTLGSNYRVNGSGSSFVSWSFRKAPGFFDIVTYSGNSTAGRQIPHNLGSVPGCILVKRLTTSNSNWAMYHRGVNGGVNPENYWMTLNDSFAKQQQPHWNNTAPTSTHFTVGNDWEVNGPTSQNYVAYIFAHDEQIFGNRGNNSVINCGYYTGNSSTNGPDVNLGWEAQWVLIKRTSGTEDWMLFDHMRTSRRQDMWLDDMRPNNTGGDGDGAASDSQPFLNWTSTGFKLSANTPHTNNSGDNYIYIAIRRPDGYVGKPVTAGTQVFTPVFGSSGAPLFKTPNHYVDWSLQKNSNFASSSATWNVISRLRSQEIINTDDNQPEGWNTYHSFDFQNGQSNFTGGSGIRFAWNWRRYAGMDVVQYTGNGSTRNIIHSLNNIPEMIVVKKLNGTGGWQTYHVGTGNTKYLYWNQDYQAQTSSAVWADTTPTKSVFTVGGGAEVNENTYLYQAFLFASVSGVSKLGSYTGTSSNPSVTITTGFSPRFLLIKRTDSARDWNVFDTVRGIGSGFNDYRLTLNTTAAQNNGQYVDVTATGFTAQSTLDVGTDGGEYIYYAHA